jgi:type I restriction enzyme S subunit
MSTHDIANIPDGWVETTLGEITKIMSGSTPSTKEPSFWDGDISWITPKDLSTFQGTYISNGERNITIEWLKNSSAQLLPPNTVLFSSRAPIWYIAIAKKELATNQWFKNMLCDEKRSHYKFIFYWLKANTEQVEKLSSGSTFSEASTSVMRSLQIILPSLPEQKAIAQILSSFDDKIELLREQNETLEKIAQTVFAEWFGKYSPEKPEELPEGWRVGKFDEVVEIRGGTTPSTQNSDFWDWDISWTSPKDLSNSKSMFLLQTECKITIEWLKQIGSWLLPIWTLLLSSRAPIWYLSLTNIDVAINQGYIAFLEWNIFSNRFMYLWLKSNMQSVINASNGSTFLEISKSSFRLIDCVIPQRNILIEFDWVIKPIFEKILSNLLQIQSLSRTRDELLARLMNGEVKVEV